MAQPGFILVRSPRSTTPRHIHSSNTAAKTAVTRNELQKGPPVIIRIDKTEVAQICEVPQNLLDYYDIKQNVFFSDILWANALKLKGRNKVFFSPLPKFNDTRRDLAIVVDKQVRYSDIVNITRQKGGKTIKSMNLFDVYEGITVGAGKKSYAIAYFLRDDDKTLTDEQIEKTMTQLINLYGKEFGATIR